MKECFISFVAVDLFLQALSSVSSNDCTTYLRDTNCNTVYEYTTTVLVPSHAFYLCTRVYKYIYIYEWKVMQYFNSSKNEDRDVFVAYSHYHP